MSDQYPYGEFCDTRFDAVLRHHLVVLKAGKRVFESVVYHAGQYALVLFDTPNAPVLLAKKPWQRISTLADMKDYVAEMNLGLCIKDEARLCFLWLVTFGIDSQYMQIETNPANACQYLSVDSVHAFLCEKEPPAKQDPVDAVSYNTKPQSRFCMLYDIGDTRLSCSVIAWLGCAIYFGPERMPLVAHLASAQNTQTFQEMYDYIRAVNRKGVYLGGTTILLFCWLAHNGHELFDSRMMHPFERIDLKSTRNRLIGF